MKLPNMFSVAKKINTHNQVLRAALPEPLNQIKLAQIIGTTAIFIAENQSILHFAKQQHETIICALNENCKLSIEQVEITLKR